MDLSDVLHIMKDKTEGCKDVLVSIGQCMILVPTFVLSHRHGSVNVCMTFDQGKHVPLIHLFLTITLCNLCLSCPFHFSFVASLNILVLFRCTSTAITLGLLHTWPTPALAWPIGHGQAFFQGLPYPGSPECAFGLRKSLLRIATTS